MDVVSNRISGNNHFSEKQHIDTQDLLTAFQNYANKISVLSLDCFDTLLWRKTAAPTDVFYDLQQRPAFLEHHVTASLRIQSETIARRLNYIKKGTLEVYLEDIYQAGCPSLSSIEHNRLIEEELAAERDACYAFLPVVDLMRAAVNRGIKIIIVSNTYLNKKQLTWLLTNILPADVMHSIDEIFCSCEFGKSKSGGLFADVLQALAIAPNTILHIGDNQHADYEAPRVHKINALHLNQFHPHISELLRLQITAATIADPLFRQARALSSPFRGVLAQGQIDTNKPETISGGR